MISERIPIFYACDDNFVKYTVVSLHSMIKNASKEYKYHVEATYKPDTEIKYSYDVAVVVWPAPQLKNLALKMQAKPATNTSEIQYPLSGTSFDVDCFAGDNFVLDYTIEGGYGLS
jgi:hypothetical protein